MVYDILKICPKILNVAKIQLWLNFGRTLEVNMERNQILAWATFGAAKLQYTSSENNKPKWQNKNTDGAMSTHKYSQRISAHSVTSTAADAQWTLQIATATRISGKRSISDVITVVQRTRLQNWTDSNQRLQCITR